MMCLNTPTVLLSLMGTDRPHCTIYCSSPTVFRHTDLPPAFGPLIISSRPSVLLFPSSVFLLPSSFFPLPSSRRMSSGTACLSCFFSERCSKGCIALIQSMVGSCCTVGSKACICSAHCALACIRSIMARNRYDSSTCSTCGRSSSLNTVRIRIISRLSAASNSRILLLASTTSAGSMNTVFPVALSSCTMPLIFLFSPGATGIISRPSRRVGAVSCATKPSRWAACRIVYKVREMLPEVCSMSWRIPASVIDAESLMWPYLSRIESILRIMAGNVCTSSANLPRAG